MSIPPRVTYMLIIICYSVPNLHLYIVVVQKHALHKKKALLKYNTIQTGRCLTDMGESSLKACGLQ